METGFCMGVLVVAVALGYFLAPKIHAEQVKVETAAWKEKAAIKVQLEALQWRVATDAKMTPAEIRDEFVSIGKKL